MRFTKFFSLLALSGFYILLATALMEIGIRLFDKAPPPESPGFFWQTDDPITGWKLIPNASGRWFDSFFEYDASVTINERSLRAPADLGYEKPAGVFRVLVLGDSFVEAAQVEWEESFPQQLGKLLGEHGLNAQVINAGVGGWGNDQQLFWLREEGYKYQPDLVVVAIYPRNDVMNNYQPLESANMRANLKPYFRLEGDQLVTELFPFDPAQSPPVTQTNTANPALEIAPGPLQPLSDWLRNHSALYRWLDPRIRITLPRFSLWLARTGLIKPGEERSIVALDAAHIPLAYHVYDPTPDAEWQAAFAVSKAILAEIKKTVTALGVETAALIVTSPEQVRPGGWTEITNRYPALKKQTWSLEFPSQKVSQILGDLQIPTLDLLPVFRERQAAGDYLHFRQDGHWAPMGHAVAGRLLFNFLSTNRLIPALNGATVPVATTHWGWVAWEIFLWIIVVGLVGSLLWSVYKNGVVAWLRNFGVSVGTAGELILYTIRRRQFVLLPVVIILLLFGALLVIAQASVVGPFIYTLF